MGLAQQTLQMHVHVHLYAGYLRGEEFVLWSGPHLHPNQALHIVVKVLSITWWCLPGSQRPGCFCNQGLQKNAFLGMLKSCRC